MDISYRKLARYNERDKNDVLEEGEIVWLKKKQNKAPKNYKGRLHYVKNGESIYSISQLYGIKLKKLYKLNNLELFQVLVVFVFKDKGIGLQNRYALNLLLILVQRRA